MEFIRKNEYKLRSVIIQASMVGPNPTLNKLSSEVGYNINICKSLKVTDVFFD